MMESWHTVGEGPTCATKNQGRHCLDVVVPVFSLQAMDVGTAEISLKTVGQGTFVVVLVQVTSFRSEQARRRNRGGGRRRVPLVRYTDEDGCFGVHRQDGVRVDTKWVP